MKQIKPKFLEIVNFAKQVVDKFFYDDCLYRASALAFTTVFSLVPLMVLTFSVVSVFPKFQTLANEFQEKVFETFVVGKGAAIYEYINEFVQRVNDLSILGIVFLLISAVTVMITVEGTLNNIWGVRDKRKGINAFLVYWSMLTLVPILLIAAIAAYTSLYTYLPFGISALKYALPYLFTLLIFFIVYTSIPNTKVNFRDALLGSIIATVAFHGFRWGIGIYLQQYHSYQIIYGVFATIPILLLWIYTIWVIVLFGAVICQVNSVRKTTSIEKSMDPFCQVLLWIYVLNKARKDGVSLRIENLIASSFYCFSENPMKIYYSMLKSKLIKTSKDDYILLNININSMSLLDLHSRLPWKLPKSSQVPPNAELNELKSVLSKVDIDNEVNLSALISDVLPGTDSNRRPND